MSSILGERAVVVGAGIGGLSMAGVLAEYFQQVDVLERDNLPAYAESRFGTPQDRHPHALMAGGLKALGQIFPGFADDLARAGAIPVRLGQDIRFERADVGSLPMRELGLSVLFASRPLTEFILRRRVMELRNVALRQNSKVTRIISSPADEVVRGVAFEGPSGRSEVLDADLVVDASGRAAPTLAMLDALGWKRPAITEVRVDITYTTAVVNKPVHTPSDWKAVITWPNPPILSLNAFLSPAEDDHWMATVVDYRQTARLETWHSFLGALKQMSTPTIYNALCYITPTPKSLQHYSFPASIWRHFERLPRLPKGVLPIGDLLCRFNPIHGQGMSVAAKQARLLRIVLEAATAKSDPLSAISTGFMAQVEFVVRTPWVLSTNADLAFPATRGERPENFEESRQYEAALFRAAVADPIIQKALMEVIQLLQPRSLLRDPDIMQRVEAAAAHRVGGKQERSH